MHHIQIWIADFGSQHKVWLGPTLKITLALAAAWMSHAALSRVNPRWRRLVWRATAIGCVLITLSAIFPPPLALHVLPPPSDEDDTVAAADQGTASEIVAEAAPLGPIVVVATAPEEPATPESFRPRYNPAEYYPVAKAEVGGGAGLATAESFCPRYNPAEYYPVANAEMRGEDEPAAEPEPVAVAAAASPADSAVFSQAADKAPAKAAASPLFPWRIWLAIWSLGAVWKLIDTLLGMQKLYAIRRRATAVPAWIANQAGEMARELGCPCARGDGHRRDRQPLHHGGLAAGDSGPQRAVPEKTRARAAGDSVPRAGASAAARTSPGNWWFTRWEPCGGFIRWPGGFAWPMPRRATRSAIRWRPITWATRSPMAGFWPG